MSRLARGQRNTDETSAGDRSGAPGKRTRTQAIQRREVQRKAGDGDGPSLTFRGVVLTAAAGEKEFRAVEDKLTLDELTDLRRIAEAGEMGVAVLLGREARRAGTTIDDAAITAGEQVAHAYVEWVVAQPDVKTWTAALRKLEEQTAPATLTATVIGTLRTEVANLPPSLRGKWYQLLQDKVIYDNQRDNASKLEKSTGGTCNLTSVSMGLEGMGYEADPDELIASVVDETDPESEQARRIQGTGMREAVEVTSADALTTWRCVDAVIHTSAFWTTTIRAVLGCGHGVFLGARNHVIRVQRVDDAAVVVDDPYGAWSFDDDKWQPKNDRPGDSVDGPTDAGNDNRWPFEKGALDDVVWVRFMAPRDLMATELAHHVEIAPAEDGKMNVGGGKFVID